MNSGLISLETLGPGRMSTADYDKLTDAELRSKLKANGYDVPLSINRDFLVRKLQTVEGNTGKPVSASNGNKKRLSLNGKVNSVLFLICVTLSNHFLLF